MGRFSARLGGDVNDYVWSVAFSQDGQMLATGNGDGTVKLWNLDELTGKPVKLEPVELTGHQQDVRAVSFSSNNKMLASVSQDRTVRLWDLESLNNKPVILHGSNFGFSSVAFSPNNQLLAATSWNGTVWLWDVDQPYTAPVVLQGHKSGVSSVSVAPNGLTLATGSHDQTICIWNLDVENLVDMVCNKVQRNLTTDEWQQFVGLDIPQENTCPNFTLSENVSFDL